MSYDLSNLRIRFSFAIIQAMKTMLKNILTIPKSVTGNEELVVMPLKQYEQIMANTTPFFYLKGKEARFLDNRVKKGLREHKEKKTIKSDSLTEALKWIRK